ncbi:sulfur carrier protein ThiS [Thermostichus vulcanus]|uniref:Sulfur carrier protein ThiS n=1 Tax=Thermostichus vulcanus str. 'Rupite' TaxID=2813851 RepID=A0ABT0CB89_THEVL|nr:sulfur carrier protein ThiS [Thermostichus vulcanus]MCJ2543053.1 sulfur carrier protein ThiS [Thermostichus vulcanus str. 'Rupite']
MRIVINQEPRELPDGLTLAEAVALLEVSSPFAVAVNQNFVPRTQYAQTPLQEGDQLEILTPVVGG